MPAASLDGLHTRHRLALPHLLAGPAGWLASAHATAPVGRERALADAALGDRRLVTALLDHGRADLLGP